MTADHVASVLLPKLWITISHTDQSHLIKGPAPDNPLIMDGSSTTEFCKLQGYDSRWRIITDVAHGVFRICDLCDVIAKLRGNDQIGITHLC